jgi:hypothetical protein
MRAAQALLCDTIYFLKGTQSAEQDEGEYGEGEDDDV